MRTIVLISALALFACSRGKSGGGSGDSPAQQETGPYHSLAVADATKLPECKDDAEGWLVYLTAEKIFQTCSGGAWSTVDIKGEKGEKGDIGGAVTVTDATISAINFKKVIDGAGVEIGTSGDLGPDITIRLKSNPNVFMGANLTSGLPEPSENVVYCYYMSSSCSGDCLFVDENRIFRLDATNYLAAKTNTVTTLNGSTQPFGSRKGVLDGACDTTTANFPILPTAHEKFHPTETMTFSLPLHLE